MVSVLDTSARVVLLTALLDGAALIAPRAAGAQGVTPDQALLNRLPAAPSATGTALTRSPAWRTPVAEAFLDGERALLNRVPPTDRPLSADPATGAAVLVAPSADGARALLNRSRL